MIYDIKVEDNRELIDFYNQAMRELDDFYQLNWIYNKPNIFVLSTKEDVQACRKEMGLGEFKTASGWVGNGGVYVVTKEIYEELMHPTNLDEQYLMLIKHELNHLFFQHISQFHTRPDWLWEGCAVYLSGQNKYKNKPEAFSNFLKFYEKNTEGNVYQESGFVIQLLVEEFGKEKLINLIKRLKDFYSIEEFQKLFREIYSIELNYSAINQLWLNSN